MRHAKKLCSSIDRTCACAREAGLTRVILEFPRHRCYRVRCVCVCVCVCFCVSCVRACARACVCGRSCASFLWGTQDATDQSFSLPPNFRVAHEIARAGSCARRVDPRAARPGRMLHVRGSHLSAAGRRKPVDELWAARTKDSK